jgi:hypothetical protein
LTSGHEEGLKKRTSFDDYSNAQDDAQRCDSLEIFVSAQRAKAVKIKTNLVEEEYSQYLRKGW